MKGVERGIFNLYLRYVAELLDKLSIDEAYSEIQACKPYAELDASKVGGKEYGDSRRWNSE